MLQHTYVIQNLLGIHVRPAKKIVECASKYPCSVYLELDGKRSSAKSLVAVLSAGAKLGDAVTLVTDGEQEEEAQAVIGALLASSIDSPAKE
ncbi:HPr family phosphocarrier protein [Gorillibacterium sp. sgz5001074]|uniref:HPr family phosphocarrier protein n=1 Tax=Gorillibacterium sp. sgz5001074 TaxID=3446695 RepID=UPI003F670E37